MVVCYNTNQGGRKSPTLFDPVDENKAISPRFCLFCFLFTSAFIVKFHPKLICDPDLWQITDQVSTISKQWSHIVHSCVRTKTPSAEDCILGQWLILRCELRRGDCKRRFGKRWEGKKGTKLVILIGFLESTQNDILNPQYSVKQLQAV